MESKEKNRRIGRLEIITIVTLMTIAVTTMLLLICAPAQCKNSHSRKIDVVIDSITNYQMRENNFDNNYREFCRRFQLIKIGNHDYILYRADYQAGICHYEDCSYCKTHNNH